MGYFFVIFNIWQSEPRLKWAYKSNWTICYTQKPSTIFRQHLCKYVCNVRFWLRPSALKQTFTFRIIDSQLFAPFNSNKILIIGCMQNSTSELWRDAVSTWISKIRTKEHFHAHLISMKPLRLMFSQSFNNKTNNKFIII